MTGDPIEDALRASLAEHARRAPDGAVVADRIVRAAHAGPAAAQRRSWRAWTLPVVAAASVAAVVAAVIGIQSYQPHRSSPLAAPHTPAVRTGSAPAHTTMSTPSATTTGSAAPIRAAGLHGIRVLDLTFAGVDDGWALASADCVGGSGRCTALLRTTDGRTWHGIPGARFNVDGVQGCADPCVAHLRFATDRVGYAYGPDALFMTIDGGASWQRRPGLGADALETLDGNVILVRAANTACPARCPLFDRAAIASQKWIAISPPAGNVPNDIETVSVSRSGPLAVVAFLPINLAKAFDSPATLFISADDGGHWSRRSEPCPAIGDGYSDNASAVTAAPDGTIVVGCVGRSRTDRTFATGHTITSTDQGRSFAAPPNGGKLGYSPLLAAATGQIQLVWASPPASGTPRLYRSTDGGNSWTAVPAITGSVTFIGFESALVGRAVTDGGQSIWTTRDAGRTWSEVSLG